MCAQLDQADRERLFSITAQTGEEVATARASITLALASCSMRQGEDDAAERSVHLLLSDAANMLKAADAPLPHGARVHVEGWGAGTYSGFQRRLMGANEHIVAFDALIEDSVAPTKLLKLRDYKWSFVHP